MAEQNAVVTWLDDAYNIEHTLIHILEAHAKEARHYPEMQAKIKEHTAQTRRHAELVKGCIERLGGAASKSTLKDIRSALLGLVPGLLGKDTVAKNGIADFAAEHFEIATYTAIITAAQRVGDGQTVAVCQEILRDEEAMARWLDDHLPAIAQGIAHEQAALH